MFPIKILIILMCSPIFIECLPLGGNPSIYDIEINFITNDKYDNYLQLNVTWKHNISDSRNNSFDVVLYPKDQNLNAHNCAEYGILEVSEGVLIPRNPEVNVDVSSRHCFIEPNTTYELIIRTSQGRIVNSTIVFIPECIYTSDCICENEDYIPIPSIARISILNNTLDVDWSIRLNNIYELKDLDKLEFFIKNLSNPTLPWGGLKDDIGEVETPLEFYTSDNGTIFGSSIIPVDRVLSRGINYEVHSRIRDVNNCVGRPVISAFRIEKESSVFFYVRITIPIVILILVCSLVFFKFFNRKKAKPDVLRFDIPLMENNKLYQFTSFEKTFEIKRSNLILNNSEYLGSGQFGDVYKAIMKVSNGSNVTVAIKTLKAGIENCKDFNAEIDILKKVGSHKNVVKFLGHCTKEKPYFIVMEFVGGGDLKRYLVELKDKLGLLNLPENNRSKEYLHLLRSSVSSSNEDKRYSNCSTVNELRPSVTETEYTILSLDSRTETPPSYQLPNIDMKAELTDFAMQICEGMAHLENLGIVHRDLAARNILIDENKTLKITDFGLSKTGLYTQVSQRLLPVKWLAVECFKREYSHKSDVWAFGIVLWEIASLGNVPYPNIDNNQIMHYVSNGGRLPKPDNCSKGFYELMLACWRHEPANRPSFKELLDWIKKLKQPLYINVETISSSYIIPGDVDDDCAFAN